MMFCAASCPIAPEPRRPQRVRLQDVLRAAFRAQKVCRRGDEDGCAAAWKKAEDLTRAIDQQLLEQIA